MITNTPITVVVASFAEAWIENVSGIETKFMKEKVASFAEAWIEKFLHKFYCIIYNVASFAEAWIEN